MDWKIATLFLPISVMDLKKLFKKFTELFWESTNLKSMAKNPDPLSLLLTHPLQFKDFFSFQRYTKNLSYVCETQEQ